MRGSLTLYISLFLLSLCLPYTLTAQSDAENTAAKNYTFSDKDHEELANMIVTMKGISPDSKIKDRLLQKLKNPSLWKEERRSENLGSVIKHLRFEDGIAFPTEEELKKAKVISSKFKQITPPMVSDKNRDIKMTLPESIELALRKKLIEERASLFTPKKISSCREDKTLAYNNNAQLPPELQADKDSDVLFDILYLSPDAPAVTDMLTGPDELFGKETLIHTYRDKMGDYPSLTASQNNVECLPFRLRVTRNKIYRHYGRNALKNFDNDEKGSFHLQVKKKLHQFL